VMECGCRLWPPTNVVSKGGAVGEGARGSRELQAGWVSKRRCRQSKMQFFLIWVPRALGVVRQDFRLRFGGPLGIIPVPVDVLGGSSGAS